MLIDTFDESQQPRGLLRREKVSPGNKVKMQHVPHNARVQILKRKPAYNVVRVVATTRQRHTQVGRHIGGLVIAPVLGALDSALFFDARQHYNHLT